MHFNDNLAREVIMKSYISPENKDNLENKQNIITKFSTTCADKLQYVFEVQNNVIKNLNFDAQGCAIFLASTDILFSTIKNKSVEQALEIIDIYNNFVDNNDSITQEQLQKIGNLWVFFNVKKHLNRLVCARLSSNSLKDELSKK
ncbi:iron-sulfur cluster assembly scaffold protein [Mycoplasmopsis ciconiae]|uniref:Iron-sulfur cluster assembly scaffold protein n=1 Tax=Mycoplasmopsis ciconiae TaxID=561067 RepID=A0ABU7MKC7_9BACT|nr:iron-sulfur cluster assembly scaffold protein [Mycoplasmopsis ciconiae]